MSGESPHRVGSRHRLVPLLALVCLTAVVLLVFLGAVRPSYLNWGSTDDERQRALPGDEIVGPLATQETRAITVHAPAVDVWAWIAQLGQDRGGFYSFDLLENLVGCRMPTVDRLQPDRQHWRIGDRLWMYPPDRAGGIGFATLRTYEPGRALGFGTRMVGTSLDEPENGSWTFVVEPLTSSRTRILVRGRGAVRRSWRGVAFDRLLFEPIHFVMERRMLVGIQELAESGSRSRLANHAHVALWMATFALWLVSTWRTVTQDQVGRSLFDVAGAASLFAFLTLGQPPLELGVVLVAVLGLESVWRS